MLSPYYNTSVISIPTINDNINDFQTLFALYSKVISSNASHIIFKFDHCRFLKPNACAFLGGMLRLLKLKMINTVIMWDTLRPEIMATLRQNTFFQQFGSLGSFYQGHAIPYREDPKQDMNSIIDYLTLNWIGRGWVRVSEPLRDEIAGKVWEIYANCFEHSASPVGVFSCGQHYHKKNELVLSVIDFGVGIPFNVRKFLSIGNPRATKITDEKCLEWACIGGHTTATSEGVARGLGLDLLKDFVRINKGKLELYTHSAYAKFDENGEHYMTLPFSFRGTILNITLLCDEKFYRLTSESGN